MPQEKRSTEREGVNEPVPTSCGFAPTLAAEPFWTKVVLAQCFGSRGLKQRLSRQHGCRESDRCPLRVKADITTRPAPRLVSASQRLNSVIGVEETRQHIGNVLPIGAHTLLFNDARNAGAPTAGSRRGR